MSIINMDINETKISDMARCQILNIKYATIVNNFVSFINNNIFFIAYWFHRNGKHYTYLI